MMIKYIVIVASISSTLLLHTSEKNIHTLSTEEFGNTELHYAIRCAVTAHPAVRYRYNDAICTLLHAKASLTVKNLAGQTPLHFATQYDAPCGNIYPLNDQDIELYTKGEWSHPYKDWLNNPSRHKKVKSDEINTPDSTKSTASVPAIAIGYDLK